MFYFLKFLPQENDLVGVESQQKQAKLQLSIPVFEDKEKECFPFEYSGGDTSNITQEQTFSPYGPLKMKR